MLISQHTTTRPLMSINSNTYLYTYCILFLLTFGIVQQIPFAPPSTDIQFLISHQHFWRFIYYGLEWGGGVKEWNFRIFAMSIIRPPPTFSLTLEFLENQTNKKTPQTRIRTLRLHFLIFIIYWTIKLFQLYNTLLPSFLHWNKFISLFFLSSAKISQKIKKMIINATQLTLQNLIIPSLVECVL